MTHSEKILNETDPFLREIYAMGFDEAYNINGLGLTLINRKYRIIKKISESEMMKFHNLNPMKIINAILIDGRKYSWISSADGSD